MSDSPHRSISPSTLASIFLSVVILPAHAQVTGISDFALTPFSVGIVGGIITGMCAPSTRWNKFGLFIWFACWVILYTTVSAFKAEHPLDAIPMALGISGLWGVIPFALTFFVGIFVTEMLRRFIAMLARTKN